MGRTLLGWVRGLCGRLGWMKGCWDSLKDVGILCRVLEGGWEVGGGGSAAGGVGSGESRCASLPKTRHITPPSLPCTVAPWGRGLPRWRPSHAQSYRGSLISHVPLLAVGDSFPSVQIRETEVTYFAVKIYDLKILVPVLL